MAFLLADELGNKEMSALMRRSYHSTSFWPLVKEPPPGVTINVVRAENSDRSAAGAILLSVAHCNCTDGEAVVVSRNLHLTV